jgi:hypothetical protein
LEYFLALFSREQLMDMLRLLNIPLKAAAQIKATMAMGGLFLKKSITNSNTNISGRLDYLA